MTDDDLKRGAELMREMAAAREAGRAAFVDLSHSRITEAEMREAAKKSRCAYFNYCSWLIEHGEALFKRAEERK